MSENLQLLIAKYHACYEVSAYSIVIEERHGSPTVTRHIIQAGFDVDVHALSNKSELELPPAADYSFVYAELKRVADAVWRDRGEFSGYTGTPDNPPTREWYEQLPDSQKQTLWSHVNRRLMNTEEAAPALIELAWSSVAALAIAPLQDVFDLGTGNRMNVPGRAEGNWRWRFTEQMLSPVAFQWLRELTESSKRSNARSSEAQAATV